MNNNVNEWSYQRYARFYGTDELKDKEFQNKIEIIKKLILEDGFTNLHDIANESNCPYDECILKICYLKNKRVLGDYYVDAAAGLVALCSPEDLILLKKYQHPIYYKNESVEEIAEELKMNKEDVWRELIYLDNKRLLNGVILDNVDDKIVYYRLEKRGLEKDYVTINCSNCGALLDVKRGSKVRCNHCDTIVEDKQVEEALIKILNKNK